MISSVRGTVVSIGTTSAVIDVHGVGFHVLATSATLASLRVGSEATIFTSLVVREDSLTLFGFLSQDEKETFDILQSVSGVGPKLALAILSVHTPDLLRSAVGTQDIAAMQRVPGVGKKGAQRLVLELGNKLGPSRAVSSSAGSSNRSVQTDVIEALIGLGWAEKDAYGAYEEASESHPQGDVATLLRASLQIMGSRG